MIIYRANVEAAKGLVIPRLGNKYVYGGMISPTNLQQGTDCSGIWNDVLGMTVGRFQWGREGEGATTESYRPKTMGGPIPIGGVGPFGTIVVARPQDIPANAVAKLAFHHGPGGGANSHMWGELDGMRIESASSKGLVTAPAAWPIDHSYANAWAYLPGPIVEDGTDVTGIEPQDTLYADVSEWQVPVTDAYANAGYRVLCIRSNDGTYRDKNWATNYAWCKRAVDDGRLKFFIVYFVWRPNWQAAVDTLMSQVGQPHPRMAVMIDVESWGGQIGGDQSNGINAAYERIAGWLGDRRRVIGYGNVGDLDRLWPRKPEGVRLVVAGYGRLPTYPGLIAHQYTDGQGYGGGLPEGAPPFGNCDMNAANGLTATAFAAALGIDTQEDDSLSALTAAEQRELLDAVRETRFLAKILADKRFVSRSPLRHLGEGATETVAGFGLNTDGNLHVLLITELARLGEPGALALLNEVAGADPVKFPDRQGDRQLAQRILASLGKADAQPEPAPTQPQRKVVCEQGGGSCILVANGGDGSCGLGGDECVIRKGVSA
ncbi:lysin A [Mycobacterium phage LilPharaoh]|uniref:Lysin A n=1 Tax=Mycobacterium phage Amelie TaxID=1913035 RepID=A0A1J0GQ18_9CAUD|nr:endolysin [Mycobacterium phage Enkosi]YP_009952544.1 endolysin [Mycobacterium phage Amelie]ATN90479.1 lysin A [Mycobacterium phage LilPharaoh]AVP42603.1 lysin A [Mycobacterium phage SgtBeansprout]AXC37132.1 lysin A [Mycobacterium phage Biglebops]QGJ93311.1 lysin A [Mycobacterium phage Mdavu]UQS94427.1 lysin A [Mycobacterium phage Nutello]UXE03188.1 lysin A [Mycobacterium phage Nikao]